MSASLRFIVCDDPNNSIEKISDIAKKKFPDWEKNEYYKKLPYKQRIVAIMTYKKRKKMLKILYTANRINILKNLKKR